MTDSDVTALRLRMLENGYTPLPATGKAVYLPGWPSLTVTPETVTEWGARYPQWRNTGMTTAYTPAVDIDTMNTEAAEAAHTLVRERFDERGAILTRFGRAPKRAVLLRTATPFPKIRRKFVDAAGSGHALEILGTGQQTIVAGVHPDTKKPYWFHGARAPWNTPHDDLPDVADTAVSDLVEAISAAWLSLGFAPAKEDAAASAVAPRGPIDIDSLLADMPTAGVNELQPRLITKLLAEARHPEEVVELVLEAQMRAARRAGLPWSAAEERAEVHGRVKSAWLRLGKKHSDTGPVPPEWLCCDFHERWMAVWREGKQPRLHWNRYAPCIVGAERVSQPKPLSAAPAAQAALAQDIPPHVPPVEQPAALFPSWK